MTNLPAFLQNYHKRDLAEKATAGLGGALPPRISIGSNRFTYVDASGNRQEVQTLYLDVCIFDISDTNTKLYYGKDYEAGSDDPPLCFSMDAIRPSANAMQPQSETCETCQWNVRGSKVSRNEVQVKACRDQKELAVTVPGTQQTWRLTVTPGSFKNWRTYADAFKGQDVGFDVIVTRIAFMQGTNGVLTFSPIGFIDEVTYNYTRGVLSDGGTDVIVGRLDTPYQGPALPAPAAQQDQPRISVTNGAITGVLVTNPGPGFQPEPLPNQSAPQQATFQPQQFPKQRGRKSNAQKAAEASAAASPAPPFTPAAAPTSPAPAFAPFRQAAVPTQTQGAFGVAPAVPPDAGLQNMLDTMFNKPS
jgi:hypothetical protein